MADASERIDQARGANPIWWLLVGDFRNRRDRLVHNLLILLAWLLLLLISLLCTSRIRI